MQFRVDDNRHVHQTGPLNGFIVEDHAEVQSNHRGEALL
jgi:hypothetical protein